MRGAGIMMKEINGKLICRENLTEMQIVMAMNCIMEGNATQAQVGSFLTALRLKGETIDEITGCAKVMREKAEKIYPKTGYCIDTCGTGGDGAGTFNISTAAAIIAAAGGVVVAKHGNRAMSGHSGSADVLEALGVDIMLKPELVAESMDSVGFGFMFAQSFHKSMKYVAGVRKELGFKTIFNLLGPLTNPASAKGQLIGVYDEKLTEIVAGVLQKLGTERALVVHGMDGLDEITTTAHTKVTELKGGRITSYYIDVSEYGIPKADISELAGGNNFGSAAVIKKVFSGMEGAERNIILVNAAAALYVGKAAESLKDGIVLAEEIIDSGRAMLKLKELVDFTTNICSGDKEFAV